MSTHRLLPLYTAPTAESPLDLTVRRPDMDRCDNHVYDESHYEIPSVSVTPPTPGYAYQHYQQNYYTTADQYTPNVYMSANHQQYAQDMRNPHVSAGYNIHNQAPPNIQCPPSPEYDASQSPPASSVYHSSILPKKRKGIWRPYDGQGDRSISMDQELDSGSDSGSNSSDHELKMQNSLEDPVKRRKRNMLRYAEEHINIIKPDAFIKPEPQLESSHANRTMPTTEMDKNVNKVNDNMNTYIAPSSGKGGFKDESRDKLISDIKKRDVFGWSLKLSKPLEDLRTSDGSQTVCQDGEKTYIELQTVRTQRQGNDTNANIDHIPQKPITAIHSQGKRSLANKNRKKNSEKKDLDNVGKTVYIQKREDVIETCNETKNNSDKTAEPTKKCVSLIDLIEEIEANAHKSETEDIEKTKLKNANIVKLLDQCNYVKLQELDYLMSNVLIQDIGPTFKNKNEKVQKMLKGDKITSVNMLDVLELQVEMGLN